MSTQTIILPRPTERSEHTARTSRVTTRTITPTGAERTERPMGLAARLGILAYGTLAYFGFVATITYAMGFIADALVPKSINSGTVGPLGESLLINAALLSLFAVQHTIMARPRFKAWITKFIPTSMERSTFVLTTVAIFFLLFWQWRPVPTIVWDVTLPVARWALIGVSLLGWVVVFVSSFLVNHFDLFGVRQVVLQFRNHTYRPLEFCVVGLYKLVRHPLMLGFLMAFWATPTMTVGHLFFATMVTGYILFGTRIEERDLVAHFGEKYLQYRREVPSLLPIRFGARTKS
jgi:protein-S-isoprenylcysteine O-methyltransferase Ste14